MTPKRSRTTQTGKRATRSGERARRSSGRAKPQESPEEPRLSTRKREKEDPDETAARAATTTRRHLLDAAFSLAKTTGARKVLVAYDALGGDLDLLTKRKTDREVVLITRDKDLLKDTQGLGPIAQIVCIPPVELSRTGQIKVALVNALVSGAVKQDERIVALSGPAPLGTFDTLLVIDPSREIEMFAFDAKPFLGQKISSDVFQELLQLAIEIAHQGREGKPVGAIFVIGDHERVLQLSRQMIINPFKGYSDEDCSIFKQEIRDTIREFAALDGAFVLREDGVVLAAGRLLSTTAVDGEVPRGLGSRHAAGAGITTSTEALAITISETDGSVRIFKEGRVLTSINKPVI